MKDLIRETRKKLGHEPEWSELAVEGISHEDYLEYQQLEGAETLASTDELLNGEGLAFCLLAGSWKISLSPSKCCNRRFHN